MSVFDDLNHFPADFSGVVRLFPLPDVVLFPHVVQPLHIFEPRYRMLLADAMDSDRLIAMVLQKTDVALHREVPALEAVACVTRIVAHAPEPDGRANILLAGLKRVLLRQELAPEKPYRQARVTVLEDEYPCSGAAGRPQMQRRLLEELQGVLQVRRNIRQQLNEILKAPIDLGVLTDILGFSLPWEPSFRQTLLEETDVDARAAWILEELPSLAPAAASSLPRPGFPPAFSEN
jgi:ATP-dependent Lon protease